MAIVNFAIPATLEKRVNKTVKEKGFGSKAEFFRFAAIQFIDIINKPIVSEDERFNYLSDEVGREIAGRYHGKKIPSAKEQLAGI